MIFFRGIRVAWRAIMASKTRSALTMLGVVVGVTSVILLVSIGEGAKRYVNEQFTGLGSNLLIITPGKTETTGGPPIVGATAHKLTIDDAIALKRRGSYLADVAPIVFGTSRMKYENRGRDVTTLGVTYEFQRVRNIYVEIGSFLSPEDVDSRRRVVVIGRTVKKDLFGDSNPLGKRVKIGGRSFRVIGITERKGTSLGIDIDDVIFIPVKTAQEIFDTDGLFEILAKAANERVIDRAKEQIIQLLSTRHNHEEDFTVRSQGAILSTLDTILTTLTWVLGAIAGISLIVGGIGIMNIMLVSVGERTREIGVRKAVGARNRDILLQFLMESVTLSLLGGTLGVLIGGGGAKLLGQVFPSLPVEISLWAIVLAFLFSASVGVFFGVYPARKASLLNPIEALRRE
ncbi:MAG: ABC transporter permease [Candidatus Tectomicrobia bacterium]|nr:ABC transporter permease [Candidatus Tectomicrobia bacterium]